MADQDPVPKRTVRFSGVDLNITDPLTIQPVVAEVIVDARLFSGYLSLAFASLIVDGSGPAEARVCSRLRIPREVLADVQRAIERVMAEEAKTREAAN